MKYQLYQVDSFTRRPFVGNPAGVVPNADGLSEIQMQVITRELNNSETAFIFSPEEDDYDVGVRFFTPGTEVPSCGHATVAAHYVRAKIMQLPPGRIIQKIGIGKLPVDIQKEGDEYKIYMTQGIPEFQQKIANTQLDALLSGLALKPSDLLGNVPVQIVSTGHSKVLVGIKKREQLHALNPNFDVLKKLSLEINCNGFHVYTLDAEFPDILTHARMFAPVIGINEDPVTGNGNGPLGAYLVKYGLVEPENETFTFRSIQGEALQRPGIVEVEVDIENSEPAGVTIGGNACIVFETEIEI